MGRSIGKRRNIKKRKRIIVLGGFVLLCLLLLAVIIMIYLRSVVNDVHPNVINKGVYIGDVDVAGMTGEEAVKAMKQVAETYGQTVITMEVKDQKAEASLAELGFVIKNMDQLVDQALNYCKTGNLWKRYRDIKKLEKGRKVIQPTYDLEQETAVAVVQERCTSLTKGAVNAAISREGKKFIITDEHKGEVVDAKASVRKIEVFMNDNWHGKSGKVKMEVAIEEPQVTKKQLSKVKNLLGTYTTYYGADSGKAQNVETSAK
ncbi:MAG: peptidoglycan binding domain-containing protein, partial [Lachnospiraceae bacterium]